MLVHVNRDRMVERPSTANLYTVDIGSSTLKYNTESDIYRPSTSNLYTVNMNSNMLTLRLSVKDISCTNYIFYVINEGKYFFKTNYYNV